MPLAEHPVRGVLLDCPTTKPQNQKQTEISNDITYLKNLRPCNVNVQRYNPKTGIKLNMLAVSLLGKETKPEEVPGGLDVLWELHEAVLGVDAPVDGPGRRPAAGCRRGLPDLHCERLRHGHPSSPQQSAPMGMNGIWAQ